MRQEWLLLWYFELFVTSSLHRTLYGPTLWKIWDISCIWGSSVVTWRNKKEILQFWAVTAVALMYSEYSEYLSIPWSRKQSEDFTFLLELIHRQSWCELRVSPRRARVAAATLALAQPRLPQLLQSWKILQCVCNERKTPNSKLEENATRKIYPRRKKAGISGGKIGGKWRKGGRGYFITAAADSGVDSTESRKKMDSPTAYSGALQAPPAKALIFHKLSWTWYVWCQCWLSSSCH